MTKTDIALYRLTTTYAELAARFGVTALTFASAAPLSGTPMAVISGYWQQIFTCSAQETVDRLKEIAWTWYSSIQYRQPGCRVVPGMFGSPVVDTRTGRVVGITPDTQAVRRALATTRAKLIGPGRRTPRPVQRMRSRRGGSPPA